MSQDKRTRSKLPVGAVMKAAIVGLAGFAPRVFRSRGTHDA